MDIRGNFEIKYQGDNKLRLPMMWSLDFARDYLKKEIYNSAGVSEVEICRKEADTYNMWSTKKVSKTEALNVYLEAFEKIKDRMWAIAWTDDRATYEIPDFIRNL